MGRVVAICSPQYAEHGCALRKPGDGGADGIAFGRIRVAWLSPPTEAIELASDDGTEIGVVTAWRVAPR